VYLVHPDGSGLHDRHRRSPCLVCEDASSCLTPPPYYRADLASIHHLGFTFHADACAPGILALLEPVRERGGLVVELGCGSGLLTKYLIAAGHQVIATDASPAMLDLARDHAVGAREVRRLTLPDDPIPHADAIVSVGHALNYLPDPDSTDRALVAIAGALRPSGVLAIDLCDVRYAEATSGSSSAGWVTDDWALITKRSTPAPDRFVREMAIFVRNQDGSWRRDDERHDNVLIDTSVVPQLLAKHRVQARLGASFGTEQLPDGLHTVIGYRPA
jgi:SAM-dependent methyltransferase